MRKESRRKINCVLERLMDRFPEEFCGKTEKLKDLYGKRYWRKDTDDLVRSTRRKTAVAYLLVLIILGISISSLMLEGINEQKNISGIARPQYGETVQKHRITARLEYNGQILKKNATIKVEPQILSDRQIEKTLADFEKSLTKRILGENKDLQHVTTDLLLFTKDKQNGILIEWLSDCPELVNTDGRVDTIMAKESKARSKNAQRMRGQEVNLTAVYALGDEERKITFPVYILPSQETDDKEAIGLRLTKIVDALEESNSGEKLLILPKTLPHGVKIRWSAETEKPFLELALLAVVVFFTIYALRYQHATKECKTDQEAILAELPDFTNKLVLLLSAGLVTEAAIQKITADYKKHEGRKGKPLYEGFCEIEKRMKETNASFLKELRFFAQKSGVRELARLETIIEENMYTGNSLSEKLEAEAAMLWFYKKKSVEERGRLAETKLTFPLVVQLIILMMITLAPVFLKL